MKTMREAWSETLIEQAASDKKLVILDGDLGTSTKASEFAASFPEQFIQVGIAEQNIVGMAAGMATLGYRPWLSSFAVFFTSRALDQIRMVVSQTKLPVNIHGSYAGLLNGAAGKTHQDIEDIAVMRVMPNLTVIAPADATEAAAATRWATNSEGPVYLRTARDAEEDIFGDDYEFSFGEPRVLREGKDVVLVSTGIQTARTLQATRLLQESGISAKLIHLATIKPLNENALLDQIGDAELVVTVEDHSKYGGLGGLVSEILAERAAARVHRIGLDDEWSQSGSNEFLLDTYGLSAGRVAEQVISVLGAK